MPKIFILTNVGLGASFYNQLDQGRHSSLIFLSIITKREFWPKVEGRKTKSLKESSILAMTGLNVIGLLYYAVT